jgi:hypothetical protein
MSQILMGIRLRVNKVNEIQRRRVDYSTGPCTRNMISFCTIVVAYSFFSTENCSDASTIHLSHGALPYKYIIEVALRSVVEVLNILVLI